MAKDQSYYFSHDVTASSDPKIVAMISEYGMIAYAWWWIILEKLASYEGYKLPLKRYTFLALDNDLGVKNEQNLTCVQHVFNKNEQNELIKEKKIKENNIERDTRAREDENPLSMFDDDEVKNKPIYELYMKSIGDISPVIKERLDDLVESYGKERVIVAINTTADNGGNSIKYVETVTAGNLKKEVNKDFGTTKRNSSNRGSSRKDEQVDWQAEYERVHGRG